MGARNFMMVGLITPMLGGTLDAAELASPPSGELSAIAATLKVPFAEQEIQRPKGHAIAGLLPRPLLMARLEERGKAIADPTVSSYWIFDPAVPDQGLRKVFSGPTNDQYLRFITPLFGGVGVAYGQLDRDKRPEGSNAMFWFDLLDGTVGPTIDARPFRDWMDESGIVYERTARTNDAFTSRIVRFDPYTAKRVSSELDFTYLKWLSRTTVLGIAKLKEGERVVRFNVAKAECDLIGELPRGYDARLGFFDEATGIYPAGPDCRDGIYAICDFSLWYMPKGEPWHAVIQKVNVVKTFGGRMPHLPVGYLGNGRFAVAKTVKDEVPVPKSWPKDDRMFGAAEAVTMLIDGRTGKVIEESKPVAYNHNPDLEIADGWWAADAKPASPQPETAGKSLFQWNDTKRELRFAGDHRLQLGTDDEKNLADDGRYLVVHPKMPRRSKGTTTVTFRIIDGQTGQIHTAEVASAFYEVLVETSWQTLCSEMPDPKLLRDFRGSGRDLFREPWRNW